MTNSSKWNSSLAEVLKRVCRPHQCPSRTATADNSHLSVNSSCQSSRSYKDLDFPLLLLWYTTDLTTMTDESRYICGRRKSSSIKASSASVDSGQRCEEHARSRLPRCTRRWASSFHCPLTTAASMAVHASGRCRDE